MKLLDTIFSIIVNRIFLVTRKKKLQFFDNYNKREIKYQIFMTFLKQFSIFEYAFELLDNK